DARVLMVVEPGAAKLAVVEREAERLDEVEPRPGVRSEADDVARVRRDLGMDERDLDHAQDAGAVRATTQFTTRAAPACFSVAASSSSVLPVVITSSTTAMLAPPSGRVARNAPRTFFARSLQGSSVWVAVSRLRSQSASSSGARSALATGRAISTAWL